MPKYWLASLAAADPNSMDGGGAPSFFIRAIGKVLAAHPKTAGRSGRAHRGSQRYHQGATGTGPFDLAELPKLLTDLYAIVTRLEELAPGRKFSAAGWRTAI
jgi:hypothetical protein